MVERLAPDPDPLSQTLKALGDPTRRAILAHLAQTGPARVTDIAGRFDISLNAVSKHIMTLERAGLARRQTKWREHLIEADLTPLSPILTWFTQLRPAWDLRLDALAQLFAKGDTDD